MTFILVPLGHDVSDGVQVNAWDWRPTVELLRRGGLLDGETLDRMSAQGAGGRVDAEQARQIADYLDGFLADLRPSQRVLLDGRITDEPRTYELDEEDFTHNYSATYEWLDHFRQFCHDSKGFKVL